MTFAATGNYEAVTVQSGPFTVAQRRITATWKGLDIVYNGFPSPRKLPDWWALSRRIRARSPS